MNKKGIIDKKFLILIVGFLIIAFAFGWFKTSSIISSVESSGVTANLILDTDEYAIYKVNIDLTGDPSARDTDTHFSHSYSTNTKGIYRMDIAENMIASTWYDADSYQINGLSSICNYQSGVERNDPNVYLKNEQVLCKFDGGFISAKFSGDVATSSNCPYGNGFLIAGDLSADCKIYKVGHEPVQEVEETQEPEEEIIDSPEPPEAQQPINYEVEQEPQYVGGILERFNAWVDSIVNTIMGWFK